MYRFLAAILCVAIATSATEALACGCTEPPDFKAHPEAAQEAFRDVALFAEAEVIELRRREVCWAEAPDNMPCFIAETAVFAIKAPYKGAVTSMAEVSIDRDPVYDPDPNAQCDLTFAVGQRLILAASFQLENDEYGIAGYHTGKCEAAWFGAPAMRAAAEDYRHQWQTLLDSAEASPKAPDTWRSLAAFYEQWRDYPSALTAYQHVAEIAPQDGPALTAIGRMLFYLRRPEAGPALERAVAQRPDDAQTRSLQELYDARFSVQYKYGAKFDPPIDLRGLDLREYRLSGVDLSGADLRGADLRGAWFERVDFTGANFEGEDLMSTVLKDAKLTDAHLANTSGLGGSPSDLKGAKLTGAYLAVRPFLPPYGANLLDADLTGAHLRCAGTPDYPGILYDAGVPMDYLEEYKLAKHIAVAQPAADLGPACRAGIAKYVEPTPETAKCAEWASAEKRPAECHVEDDR